MSAMGHEPLMFYVLLIFALPVLLPAVIVYASFFLWYCLVDSLMVRRRRPARVTYSPILPPELWHIIFAECEDQSTLLACSPVCRAWAFISRDQQRLNVSLHNHKRTVQLIHLLRSPVQTLSRAVDCAYFKGEAFIQYWRIIRLLHFHRIRLCSAIISGETHVTLCLLCHFPDSIVDLTFENAVPSAYCWVRPTQELRDSLSQVSGFKNLRSLSINSEYAEPLKVVHRGTPLSITRLSVSGIWSSDLFDWLNSACKGLVTLELLGKKGWGKEIISTEIMLQANAGALRHLKLTVPAMNGRSCLPTIHSLLELIFSHSTIESCCDKKSS